MAVTCRHPIIPLLLRSLFLLCCLVPTHASPIFLTFNLLPRSAPIINNASGYPEVFNPSTQQPVAQSPASDGAGKNFSPPALLWICFCFLIGPPLALAGIRGWRLTTGAAIGLSVAVCSWAALISSVSSVGLDDMFLTAVILAFFSAGFFLGLFEVGRMAGIILLAITGGLAIGVRVVIITKGLLLSESNLFFANWLIVAFFGSVGGLLLLRSVRAGITIGAASTGTFLSFLGVDLIMNKQAGMSRGLRFLFDRNASHILDIIENGYHPPLSTTIIIGISLGFVPILAYLQHRIFPHPFSRLPPDDAELDPVNVDIVNVPSPEKQTFNFNPFTPKGKSRFSL